MLRTRDGVRLRAASWPGSSATKGTVLILQGRTEFIEKYFETIAELRARGYAVAAFDWRGQGLSDRALPDRHKGHVGGFAEYHLDIDCVLETFVMPDPALPPPYTLLAHSMGAHIALRYLHDRPEPFARAVLCSPMAYINTAPLPHFAARAIAAGGAALGLAVNYVPGGHGYRRTAFRKNILTHDLVRHERNEDVVAANLELALGSPTFGWLDAAYRSMAMVNAPQFCAAVKAPAIMIHGAQEQISLPQQQARLASLLGNCEAVCITGARHEILQETDDLRAQFWAAFDRFMGRH